MSEKIWDYLFEFISGDNEGEQIFVECSNAMNPWDILAEYGWDNSDLNFVNVYTPDEAEILGYDTY